MCMQIFGVQRGICLSEEEGTSLQLLMISNGKSGFLFENQKMRLYKNSKSGKFLLKFKQEKSE